MQTTDAVTATEKSVQLARAWAAAFAAVLESLLGAQPPWQCSTDPVDSTGEPLLGWEQSFNLGPEPAMWAGLSEKLWAETGRSALAAADLPPASDEEVRNTLREMLAQAFSSFAVALGAQQGLELTATSGSARDAVPDGWTTVRIEFQLPDQAQAAVLLSMHPWWLTEHVTEESNNNAVTDPEPECASAMDLLLDVELPVSVSFGRTRLPLEELLKLGAGSIIELGRNADDPVELIVNNCVVALGEVVVVDGNYGVRILRIASRAERLRTGSVGARFGKAGARP